MKKTMIILLTLVMALLVPFACAETSATVQGVFDALTAEGSDYNQTKAMYAQYFENIEWGEAVEGDSIVITVANSEGMDGTWTFTQDGDALTATFGAEDFTGLSMTMDMLDAVGSYLGMETDVISGYVNGLAVFGIENDKFVMQNDEAAGTTTVRIRDDAAWDMAELDQMVLDDKVVEPLEDHYTSTAANIGKVMMVANKEGEDGLVILLGEFGGLDDLAYQSIINVVGILKPAGWEDFTANYTELSDAETDAYTVKLNADAAEAAEIIEDAKDSYSFAILRFHGSGDAATEVTSEETNEENDGEEQVFETPAPAEAPTVEEFTEGYFNVLANLETETAGASMKAAVAASEVCSFAVAHDLYNPDVEPMRANMLTAYEAMDEDA